jgi:hypothetical protein
MDAGPYGCHDARMAGQATKRVTVNLPEKLLRDAESVTGAGITKTIVEGLELVARRRAVEKVLALRGKLDLRIDLDVARERRR